MPAIRSWSFSRRRAFEYVVAVGRNARLARLAGPWLERARRLAATTGEPAQLFGETRYAPKTWSRRRRVIIKAEVLPYPDRDMP